MFQRPTGRVCRAKFYMTRNQQFLAARTARKLFAKFIAEAPQHLQPGGLLALEIGIGQADALKLFCPSTLIMIFRRDRTLPV